MVFVISRHKEQNQTEFSSAEKPKSSQVYHKVFPASRHFIVNLLSMTSQEGKREAASAHDRTDKRIASVNMFERNRMCQWTRKRLFHFWKLRWIFHSHYDANYRGESEKELFVSVHIATEMQKACFLCEQRAGEREGGREKIFWP